MAGFVRPSTREDASALARSLRPEDVRELEVMGSTPMEALTRGFERSDRCYSVVLNSGEVIAMFGVGPSPEPDVGVPWMLCSPELAKHGFMVSRFARLWYNDFHRQYSVLTNWVHEANELHIKWTRWCGCTFIRRHENVGVNQDQTFVEFVRIPHV